jgi:hypothetical protein
MVALSLSDSQAEAFLSGSIESDGDLESIAGVLAAARDLAQPDPEADFSALFAAAARESRVTPIERFANEQFTRLTGRRPQLVQRVAIAGAALLVFVTMSGGLAYAADGAKPGDLMYGLDRALEAVAIGGGGATERLAEVEALIAAGAIADGLRHVSAVLDGHPDSDEARAALSAAAARFESAADGPGSQAAQVGALITYLHDALDSSDGVVDGQMVAGMVRGLGRSQGDPAGAPVEPGSQGDPAGRPAEPGPQGDPSGRPAEPGSQGDPEGPPAEPGSQGDPAGRPAEPGSQGDPAGRPAEPGSQADPAGPPAEPGSQSSAGGHPEQGRKEK